MSENALPGEVQAIFHVATKSDLGLSLTLIGVDFLSKNFFLLFFKFAQKNRFFFFMTTVFEREKNLFFFSI